MLFLLTLSYLSPGFAASYCQKLASSYIEAGEVLAATQKAIETLLDPRTPLKHLREFDYGVRPQPGTLLYFRGEGLRSLRDPDSLPTLPHQDRLYGDYPIPLDSPTPRPDSNLVYFKNHFFSNNFFLRNHSTPKGEIDWLGLNKKQAWLEWDSQEQVYKLRKAHAGYKILQLLPQGPMTLYRGVLPQEAAFFQLYKKIAQFPIDKEELAAVAQQTHAHSHLRQALEAATEETSKPTPKIRAELKRSLLRAYVEDLKTGDFSSALFATPLASKAEIFAKGRVLKLQVSQQDLLKLYQQDSLYVGIEDNVEFAFIGEAGIEFMIESLVASYDYLPRGNIWLERQHPLWK